jgi:peptidoglycan/xylan/chitin deacetylase (PgdA/CDA1 family)
VSGGAAGSGGAGVAGSPGGGGAGGNAGGGGMHECAPLTSVGSDLGTLAVESVATWKGDAKGAYTIIHDDVCDYTIDSLFDVAEPELSARGLHSAFGAIVSRCEERKLWSKLELMRQHGHEIINHTWDHKDMVEDAQASLAVEIDQATQVLDANLVGQQTSFFIFPYDSFNDAAVQHLGGLGYLGARAGAKGVNTADFADGLRVMFDVYGGENSIYDGQGDILQIYVDLAISEGGWSVREFHGVADQTFWAMDTNAYKAHLDYVKSKVDSGELWVDTPSTVVRYRFARQYCGLPAVMGSSLVPAMPSADCARYATAVSTIVTTTVDAPSLLASQDGKELVTKRLGPSRYLVDLDPAGCPVALGGSP